MKLGDEDRDVRDGLGTQNPGRRTELWVLSISRTPYVDELIYILYYCYVKSK